MKARRIHLAKLPTVPATNVWFERGPEADHIVYRARYSHDPLRICITQLHKVLTAQAAQDAALLAEPVKPSVPPQHHPELPFR